MGCDAELLFVSGGYVLHWQEHGIHHYRSLSPDAVKAAFVAEPSDTDWLPPNIVRVGTNRHGTWVIGGVASAIHEIVLAASDGKAASTLRVPLPAFIFAGSGGVQSHYWVWATTDSPAILTPQSRLYNAPLPNVGSGGAICFGANPLPPVSPQSLWAAWQLFMGSPFSHPLDHARCRSYGGDPRPLLNRLHRTRRRTFPTREMVAATTPTTLDSLAHALTTRL